MSRNFSKSLPSFIWQFIKSYKFITLIFILLAIAAGLFGPFNSILIKKILNALPAASNGDTSPLYRLAALIVLNFLIFDNFTWRCIGYINYKYQVVIKNKIISEILDHTLSSSEAFFSDRLTGRILDQITTLTDNIELMLNKFVLDFIRGASLLIISFVVAYSINQLFFYTLFFWFLAFSSFSILMSNKVVNLSNKYASAESLLSGQIADCITNQNNIKIFARKEFEIYRMSHFFNATQKEFQSKEFFVVILYFVQGSMIAVMISFSAFFLVHLYGKKLVEIGDFALILGLAMQLGNTTWYTITKVDDFSQALGKCKQSLSELNFKPDITDKDGALEIVVKQGQIIFDNVNFNYKGTEPLFQSNSIIIEAGEKVGLAGYSGSGKTTFVNLILRLYDVSSGRILIDGQDIQNITQESLRRNIAVIPQDPLLFNRSLMDNIRYGKIDATDKEVINASKKAHAHEFISKLAKGYNADAGERGTKLSGGQRQRIAIARAILKNAPILILDEATSGLDYITENQIQESLDELMKNKTTIIVAHRLSTILNADRIIVFDNGKIVEDGNHAKLISSNELYKHLLDSQTGGLLPEKAP